MERTLEKMVAYWAETSYLHPLVIVTSIYVAIKLYRYKDKSSKLFKIYVLSVSMLFFTGDLVYSILNLPHSASLKVVEIANNFFAIAEMTIFSLFFISVLNSNPIKLFLKIAATFIALAGLIINTLALFTHSPRVYLRVGFYFDVTHLIILMIPCAVYFFEIYKKNEDLELRNALVILSIFGYAIVSVPFLVTYEDLNRFYIRAFNFLSWVHYLLIIFVLMSFTICKSKPVPSPSYH